jgi:hypothetical protein
MPSKCSDIGIMDKKLTVQINLAMQRVFYNVNIEVFSLVEMLLLICSVSPIKMPHLHILKTWN